MTPARPRSVCVQSLVPIGSEMEFSIRNIRTHRHTDKQTFSFIYKMGPKVLSVFLIHRGCFWFLIVVAFRLNHVHACLVDVHNIRLVRKFCQFFQSIGKHARMKINERFKMYPMQNFFLFPAAKVPFCFVARVMRYLLEITTTRFYHVQVSLIFKIFVWDFRRSSNNQQIGQTFCQLRQLL